MPKKSVGRYQKIPKKLKTNKGLRNVEHGGVTMNKSLVESIMDVEKSPRKAPSRRNKLVFIALKNDISEALEKGCSVTAIWETLREEGRFTASYNTFRLYVQKYLNGQKPGYARKKGGVE